MGNTETINTNNR